LNWHHRESKRKEKRLRGKMENKKKEKRREDKWRKIKEIRVVMKREAERQ